MKVNFNNVRKQACYAHDQLISQLNGSSEHEGYLLVDPYALDKILNDLRQTLGTIAMTYQEGDEEFKDVFEEIYPGQKTMSKFKYDAE